MSEHLLVNGIQPADTIPGEQGEALLSDKKEQEKEDMISGQERAEDNFQVEERHDDSSDHLPEKTTAVAPSGVDSNSEVIDKMEDSGPDSSPPPPAPSKEKLPAEDESMETNEGEEDHEETATNEEDEEPPTNTTKPTCSRTSKSKIHSRNLTYPSIIRTRRSCGMDKKQNIVSPSVEDTSGEESSSIDGSKDKRSNRGRGRGGGAPSVKRLKSLEKESVSEGSGNKAEGSSNKVEGSSNKVEGSSNRGMTSGRGKSTLMTRAAAAGLKGGVQFHQLPRRPKRQKTREEDEVEDEDEQDQPATKKNKFEPENSKELEDHAEEKMETEQTGKGGVKSSPKVKGGRGRGRRVKGMKASAPIEDEEDTADKNKVIKEEIADEQEELMDSDKRSSAAARKRRGRPKKTGKESSTPTPTPTDTPTGDNIKEDNSVSGEDMDAHVSNSQEITEPAKGTNQINELLELSENLGSEGEDTPTPADQGIPIEGNNDKSKNNMVTPTEHDNVALVAVQNSSVESTDKNQATANMKDNEATPTSKSKFEDASVSTLEKENTEKNKTDQKSPSGDSKATSTSTDNATPTSDPSSGGSAGHVEPTYSFPAPPNHRYSPLDEQGYHHFTIPPPFIATGFTPFPSYHPFMLPTSPHFPHQAPPFPADCVPEMYHRFPEDFPRGYPIPPPTAIPTGTNNTNTTTSATSQVTESSTSNTSTSATTPSTTHATCITVPLPIGQGGYPVYTLPSPYGPPPIVGTGMPPPSMLPPAEWNMPPPQGPPPPPPPQAPPSQAPPSSTTTPTPTSTTKTTKESKFPLNLISSEDPTTSVSQPVDCPECGRHFKNNKALNGHMRLHGGFDWTRRPYQVMQSRQQQLAREAADKKTSTSSSKTEKQHHKEQQSSSSNKKGNSGKSSSGRQQLIKNSLKNLTPPQPSSHTATPDTSRQHTGTLADLCRAAEELERIERNGETIDPNTFKGNKPTPLILPHERRLQSFSPPYTPPPILSPARSLMLLSNSAERLTNTSNNSSHLSTNGMNASMGETSSNIMENSSAPNKIWPQRKVSDQRQSEQEDLMEPKINVGHEFQAEFPPCKTLKEGDVPYKDDNSEEPPSGGASLVWAPMEGLLQEDEDTVDGFLELSCSPAVPHGGRNKELALHVLHQVKGSVKEAVRMMVMGKALTNENMSSYNYSGSKKWSSKERQLFRRAWRVHRKNFQQIQNQVDSKSMPELIEYYYSWKKHCSDEYRGRSRHHSEEAFSEDEGDIYVHPPSVTSTSSGSNDMLPDPPQQPSLPTPNPQTINDDLSSVTSDQTPPVPSSTNTSRSHQHQPHQAPVIPSAASSSAVNHHNTTSLPTPSVTGSDRRHLSTTPAKNRSKAVQHHDIIDNIPTRGSSGLMSAPPPPPSITSPYGSAPVQEYRCKYPGCNQVYTSIFALNGHIRVHGGSWYPKKPDVESMHSNSKESSSSGSSHSQSHSASHSSQSHSASHSSHSSHPASHSSQFHSASHSSQSHSISHSSTTSLSKLKKEKEEEEKLRHQLEIAKTMVMDLPQPRSPAQTMVCNAPSPRPSPSHAKSSLIKSKKVSSASPADREGHYPCNRCGRVFPKVKSRSAHMKSHIVKPVKH